MKTSKNLRDLEKDELQNINGGWIWPIGSYILGEIIEGVQEGISNAVKNDCDVQCPAY